MNTEIKLKELDFQEAARYLGYGQNEIDEQTLELMHICQNEIIKNTYPKIIYRVFDIERSHAGIEVLGTNLVLSGEAINNHLCNCNSVVLMAATLAEGADRLIRTAQVCDMAKAVVMDSMASVAVEQVCDMAEQMIRKELPEYYQTFRFGLGYGDLPIQLQGSFLKAINAEKLIGLHINESSMLVPTKSVTAVIGLSKQPIQAQSRGCQTCNMRQNCKFKRTGGHCNG